MNLHGGLEDSGFHPQTGSTGSLHKVFIKFRCGFGTRSTIEAGTTPLSAIAVQGELGDNQQLGSDVTRAEVHLAGVVVENPETGDFVHQPVRILIRVFPFDSQQDQKSAGNGTGNFAVGLDPRTGDSLQDRFHRIQYATGGSSDI